MSTVQPIGENLYVLDDGRVRQFLMTGDRQALLIDTGFEDSRVLDAVRSVTNLPIQVVLTHGDRDHAGGLRDFGSCRLHRGDWHLIPEGIGLEPLEEGEVLTCGGYRLEVVEIPGHTLGSIALVEREKRLLFPGDSVQRAGPIYMFGSHRNLDLYIASQKKLCAWADKVDTVLPCHHDCPIDPSYIEKDLEDALALKAGALPSEPHPFLPCRTYHGKWTDFYYQP